MINPTASSPGSAPAVPTLEIPTNEEDRKQWQLTGKLPAEEPEEKGHKTEKEEDDKPESGPAEVEDDSDIAASPEDAQETLEEDAPDEVAQLYDELNVRDSRIEELQRQIEELRSGHAKPATEQGAKAADGKPQPPPGKDAPKEPTLQDKNPDGTFKYAGDSGFEAYLRDVRAFDRQQMLADIKTTQTQTVQEQQIAAQNKLIEDNWNQRVVEAEKKYPDFRAVGLSKELLSKIPQNSAADHFILESKHGTDLLYYFGKHPKELDRIARLNPIAQARELVHLEDTLSGKSSSSSAATTTRVGRPPAELHGRGSLAPDAVEQAVKEGDQDAYMAEMNRRDRRVQDVRARRKG